jgi:4-amino-4-deoxy-L-arabinose transferase-like glycosyltransferase
MIGNQQSDLAANRRHKVAVALVLLLSTGLATIYSIVTPIFEGYDEHWHYAYVQHIATGRGLPRQPPDQYHHLAQQEASQPPLYYLLAAALTWWVPTDDLTDYLRENPHWGAIPWDYVDNLNRMIHTDAERFPYKGTVLAVHIARMLSVLLGAGTTYCTYALARTLFPTETAVAFGAMIITALTPSFLFISGLVSNDGLVAFLSTLALLLLARLWGNQVSDPTVALLGIVLGGAALAKLSGLLLWPLAGLMLAILAWRKKSLGLFAKTTILTFSLAGLICGWWYIRNMILYGDVTGLNMMLDAIGRREPGFGLQDVVGDFQAIRWSYWAFFGWANVPVAGWLYRVYDLISLVAIVGLGFYIVRVIRDQRWNDLLAVAFLSVWLSMVIPGLVRWTLTTPGSNGRLLYPAISAISILLIRGWLQLVPQQSDIRQWAVLGIGFAFFGVAGYVPFFVIKPAYARPPSLSLEEVGNYVSQRTNVHFEDQMTLLGHEVDRQEVKPGDLAWVTVCWKGERKIEEDYFVFVHLLVDHDLIAAQKDTYHGLGSFPTSLWPAGIVFCDRYPLVVPDTTPASSQGLLSIGLYRRTGERLQVYSEDRQPMGDNICFAGPRVVFPEGQQRLSYDWGHQVALVDYQLDKTAVIPGESLRISSHWRALQRMPSDYVVTIQVVDEHSTKIGQSDAPLSVEGQPTSAWQPGTVAEDHRTIQISPNAAPGVYKINVGVYEPSTIQNLTLYRNRQALPSGGLLTLWKLRVLSAQPLQQ